MDLPREVLDMSKQERKTTEVRKCEKHNCDLEEIRPNRYDAYEWLCPVCIKEKKDAEKMAESIKQAHMNLSLPKRLSLCSFESYSPKGKESANAKKTCMEYVDNWPSAGGGIMLGGVGTGKTHLVSALCKGLCDKAVSCEITTVNRVVRNVRSVWNGGTPDISEAWNEINTEKDVVEYYSTKELLVIDEIGSQYGTDSERIIVNEIINNRYENMLPTIAIGNVTLSEAKDILGDRVVDRLRHDGFLLIFDWESYRV